MSYYDGIIEDLYWQADEWGTLWDCSFYYSDAEYVDYLIQCCNYSYWDAIREVIIEIEYEVYSM